MSPTSTLAAALLALQCAAACARFAPPPSVGRRTRGGALWRLRGGAGEEQLADSDIFTLGDSAPWLRYVRTHGVLQFISILRGMEDSTGDELLWGDEIEYHILATNASAKTVRLSLRAPEVLAQLSAKEQMLGRRDGFGEACAWHPEYGAWMVEGTPRIPYGGFTSDLCRVEPNMRLRRKRLASTLAEGEIALTIPAFPLMGVGTFTEPPLPAGGPITESSSVPDGVITPLPRFHALTRNIRERRSAKVDIRIPRLRDVRTPTDEASRDIHMDAMAYGMGCCCLQVTFQARDIDESRHLYDHLAVLSPIMLALTAASPILHGSLADTDVRWATVAASVDDRTPMERGHPPPASPPWSAETLAQYANGGVKRLPKSRYESISVYLANCAGCHDSHNDLDAPVDAGALALLLESGIDDSLARHVAHLFVRDPLVIRKDRLHLDDETDTDHWENLQSTNWQTVRWKPPPKGKPCGPHVGWRVEFRSMEVGLTDFENAAFTTFIVLASRVILAFDLNLYIPLSKVDENMRRAHQRSAATRERFYFRSMGDGGADGGRILEMTIADIVSGRDGLFPGLVPLIFTYLEEIECDPETLELMRSYMELIERRAAGELLTPATWMRDFVSTHPEYQQDSEVPESVAYDLLQACADIGEGRRQEPTLLGRQYIPPLRHDDAWPTPLTSPRLRSTLLARYRQNAAAGG